MHARFAVSHERRDGLGIEMTRVGVQYLDDRTTARRQPLPRRTQLRDSRLDPI